MQIVFLSVHSVAVMGLLNTLFYTFFTIQPFTDRNSFGIITASKKTEKRVVLMSKSLKISLGWVVLWFCFNRSREKVKQSKKYSNGEKI